MNCLVLGICYIGTLRNKSDETSVLLRLPENVYPVFGLCIGYPAEGPDLKSRIPASVILKSKFSARALLLIQARKTSHL